MAEPSYGRLTTAAMGQGAWLGERRCEIGTRPHLREALIEVNFGRPHDQHPQSRGHGGRRGVEPRAPAGDGAAGIMLVLEAGGIVGDLDGPSEGRWPASGGVLAAPAALWEPLRVLLAEVYATP